jgi:hypothetical protein
MVSAASMLLRGLTAINNRMWRTIGITIQRNGGYRKHRAFGKPLFQSIIFYLALNQADQPAIVVNHDGDKIRLLKDPALTTMESVLTAIRSR